MQTSRKLSVRNTAQNGQQQEKWSEAAPEIGIYLALTVVRNAKGYNLSAVLSRETAAMLCICGRSTVHTLLKNITKQIPTPWTRSLNIYEGCSLLFPPTLHAVFGKHPKSRNHKAENGSIFGREKNKTSTFEM